MKNVGNRGQTPEVRGQFKFETRTPEIRGKPEFRKPNEISAGLLIFLVSDFEFLSDFGFRNSELVRA